MPLYLTASAFANRKRSRQDFENDEDAPLSDAHRRRRPNTTDVNSPVSEKVRRNLTATFSAAPCALPWTPQAFRVLAAQHTALDSSTCTRRSHTVSFLF